MITLDMLTSSSGRYPERAKSKELTPEVKANGEALLSRVNSFLEDLGVKFVDISSGFRPSDVNAKVPGSAKKSNHMVMHAVDLVDKNGSLAKLIKNNLDIGTKYNLYFEDFASTIGWVHIQDVSPKSGNRVFKP